MSTNKPSASAQIIAALSDNTSQLTELKLSMQALAESVVRVTSLVDGINRTLRGADGSSGLVGRIELLERADRECEIDRIKAALDGDGKEPGLLERMRRMEKFQEGLQRWFYLVGSAILLDFAMRLWPELLNLVK